MFKKINKRFTGGKHTEEFKRKMSERLKGDKNPAKRPEVRKKMRITRLKNNPGAIKKGERRSRKTEFVKGHAGYWKGKKQPEIMKIKRGIYDSGKNSSTWRGGLSFEPYTTDWTETLRRAIRERDNYICQICSQYGNIVHHIDYNKENCNPDNLITLCQKCHLKTNYNRDYWINYFQCLKL